VRVLSAAAADPAVLVGAPVYTFINKFLCVENSQTIKTKLSCNAVANLMANLNLSIAQKLGQQYSFGYVGNSTADVPNEELDVSDFVGDFWVSAHLYSLIVNYEKLMPLFLLKNMRMEFE
jgi:hypothetical protein